MKSTLALSFMCVCVLGCVTEPKGPPWAKSDWQPDGRLKIAVIAPSDRAAAASVTLYQPNDSPPPHTVLSFVTADGDAAEEARIVTMILDYARHIGASGVVLLGADKPNENLALARPLWQPTGRRVFRANVIAAKQL